MTYDLWPPSVFSLCNSVNRSCLGIRENEQAISSYLLLLNSSTISRIIRENQWHFHFHQRKIFYSVFCWNYV
jgi:hypothetical protein